MKDNYPNPDYLADIFDIGNLGRGEKGHFITIGDWVFYFSYGQFIGMQNPKTKEKIIIENLWSGTTGQHLNRISEKDERLSISEFDKRVREKLKELGLIGD